MTIASYVFSILAPIFVVLNGFSLHEAIQHPTYGVYSATTPLLLSVALFAALPELTKGSASAQQGLLHSVLIPTCYLGLSLNFSATLAWIYRHHQLRQIIQKNQYDAYYKKVVAKCGKSCRQIAFVHSCEDGIAKIGAPHLSIVGWPHFTLVGYGILGTIYALAAAAAAANNQRVGSSGMS